MEAAVGAMACVDGWKLHREIFDTRQVEAELSSQSKFQSPEC